MPITREHDTDDDGSGLTGTIRDAAWKERLYDQIDAYVKGGPIWTFRTLSISGSLANNWNPWLSANNTSIQLQPTEAVTITGLQVPSGVYNGLTIVIANGTPWSLSFAHEDTRSAAGNRLRCQASPLVTANSFWGFAIFQYFVMADGGFWLCVGRANGIGG